MAKPVKPVKSQFPYEPKGAFRAWYADGGNHAIAPPAGWDQLMVGSGALNAWARLSAGGEGPHLKIDPRKKAGALASNPTTHGMDAWEFAFRLIVLDLHQLDDVDAAWRAIWSVTDKPKPVVVEHPSLFTVIAALGSVAAIVKNLPVWVPSSQQRGALEASMQFLHWPAGIKGAGQMASATPTRQYRNVLAEKQGAGAGTVLLNTAPTAQPTYAEPKWP